MTLLPIALLLVVVYLLIARKSRVSLFRRLLVPMLFSLFVTLHLKHQLCRQPHPSPGGHQPPELLLTLELRRHELVGGAIPRRVPDLQLGLLRMAVRDGRRRLRTEAKLVKDS
ncbi:hypothetical protein FE782_01975 [Paenibacillus antri]|uniref:Uncharacterized protein n=1 Tax=Paenibacillus antri TaxID=2582848 RepID=A0A5R9GCD7_9BACL|nr:hypothetical protein [Paenibacillus antri]TLS54137.1 hypothetical protein FE782_01975 [Paenibacillus antri]